MWALSVCVVGVLSCVACARRARGEELAVTTVFVVCPAETAGEDRSLRLTGVGLGRAADLRELLQSAAVEAVYAAGSNAAYMTGAPTAAGAGLEVQVGALPEARELLSRHPGGSVLVVTDPGRLATALGRLGSSSDLSIDAGELDNLFILRLEGQAVLVTRWRYGPLARLGSLRVTGNLLEGDDLSGVVRLGEDLVICSDEGTAIQELLHRPDGSYAAQPPLPLVDDEEIRELDLEGLAVDGGELYAVGSHSPRRLKTDHHTYRKNRKRLKTVTQGGTQERNRIFRLRRTDGDEWKLDGSLDLHGVLEADPYLGRFAALPGKENGIDIEAIAVDGSQLLLGLRGPLLRGNFAPVLRVRASRKFKHVKQSELSFVQLDGRGIRGMARVTTGLLLLAGPMSDLALPYRLYHWDGEDMVPGERKIGDGSARPGRVTLLGTVPTPPGGKAEGITVLSETEVDYEILVIFDQAPGGAPTRFRARKVPGL